MLDFFDNQQCFDASEAIEPAAPDAAMSRNNIVLRLGLVSRKRHHHIALFSTSTARPAKARPVSKVTLAQVALRRMFARQGSKPEFPKAVSILHGVHGHVNGRAVFASAASESITNVISETLARECSLHVSPAVSGEWLLLPDGREIKPVGIATGKWSFRGETSIQATVDFAVLKSPSRPLILGSDLLRSSRTTDINWHRLRTRTTEPEDFSCVHIVGEPPSSIAGKLEGNPIYALAATGCEVSLVSLDFVTKNYLKFKWKSPKEPHSLKFIDGGCIPIDKTIVLHWQYGDEWTEWPAEFVVVPGLPWDVVLGQQFLYGSGAFFRYVNCFRKARPTSRQAGISAMPSLLMLSFAAKPGEFPFIHVHNHPRIRTSQADIITD